MVKNLPNQVAERLSFFVFHISQHFGRLGLALYVSGCLRLQGHG